jgi:hypothetical protein
MTYFITELPCILGRLPTRWRWTFHNLLGHPLSEILFQLGFHSASELVHDRTIPV